MDDLKPFLQQIGMNSSVVEAHALFTGLNCSQVESNEDNNVWLDKLNLGIDQQNVLDREAVEVLNKYYNEVNQHLNSIELSFQLPISDADSIAEQLSDFALWVENFLYGFSMGDKVELTSCSEQLQEIIKDFVSLSRADDYEATTDDDNEKVLVELIEYVRVAVLNIYDELNLKDKPQPIIIE